MKLVHLILLIVGGMVTAAPSFGDTKSSAQRQRSCEDGLRAFDSYCKSRHAKYSLKFQDCVIYRMAMIGHKFRYSYRLLGPENFYCVGKPLSCSEGVKLTIRACSGHHLSRRGPGFRKCVKTVMSNYGYRKGPHYSAVRNKMVCNRP